MNYYIFRHGETFFTKNDIPYYNNLVENAEILTEGIPVIEKLAEKLKDVKIDAGFTSPYKRCIQTSDIIHKATELEFKIDERLHDINAESINHMVTRLKSFFDEVTSNNYKSIAICSHGYPIAILQSLITKGKFELEDLISYPKPGVLVTIRNNKVEYTDFN